MMSCDHACVVLQLLGCPGLPQDLWMAEGVGRFLAGHPGVMPGSLRELELVLGLVDPEVDLEARPGGRLCIAWRRWKTAEEMAVLSPTATRLADAVARLVAWWCPTDAECEWSMHWPAAALVVASHDVEEKAMYEEPPLGWLERFAAEVLDVHRRPPTPSRGWFTLRAERPAFKRLHELVLGDRSLEHFVFNVQRWSASVRVDDSSEGPGRAEYLLTVLGRLERLELVARPGLDRALFLCQDQEIHPAGSHRWPERYVFSLPRPIECGERLRVECTAEGDTPVRLWFNPVLMEACTYQAKPRQFERDCSAEWPPEEYPNLVAGGSELVSHDQPFPLRAAELEESDRALFARARKAMLGGRLTRRHDLTRLVEGEFPEVRSIRWERDARWTEPTPMGWLREVRGEQVTIAVKRADSRSAGPVAAAVERFLARHWTWERPFRVEINNGD